MVGNRIPADQFGAAPKAPAGRDQPPSVGGAAMATRLMTPPNPGARSHALRRGLEVLCLFTEAKSDWGISEVARHLGEHKSIVHRTVKTLEDAGFLRQDPHTHRYALGFTAYQIGVVAARSLGLTAEIRDKFRKLSEQIGATVYVVVRDGDANRIIDTFETSVLLRFHSPVGTRIPWNRGASSKLLFALSPPEETHQFIERIGLQRFTKRTIVDAGAFLAELEKIRRKGYSISDGEGFEGVLGIAAPILSPAGAVMAALQSSMPSAGLSERQRYDKVRAIVATAKEASQLLRASTGASRADVSAGQIARPG
jgi:DNA-binding IclR family transcriptional regulator